MSIELYISGIGGQGIQLMAKTLSLAALAEGRHIMLAAEYGSIMRGGSSLATVAIGATPLRSLPVIASADAAIILHQQYLEKPAARLRPDALVVTDSGVRERLPDLPTRNILDIPAERLSREIGNPTVAGLILLSAFNTATGLFRTQSLIDAMKELLPPYRKQHIAANERALIAGEQAMTMRCPVHLDSPGARAVAS